MLSLDAGRVVTFDTLQRRVWAKHDSAAANLVRIFVRHLRRKLGDSAASPAYIFNQRGVGYRMASRRAGDDASPTARGRTTCTAVKPERARLQPGHQLREALTGDPQLSAAPPYRAPGCSARRRAAADRLRQVSRKRQEGHGSRTRETPAPRIGIDDHDRTGNRDPRERAGARRTRPPPNDPAAIFACARVVSSTTSSKKTVLPCCAAPAKVVPRVPDSSDSNSSSPSTAQLTRTKTVPHGATGRRRRSVAFGYAAQPEDAQGGKARRLRSMRLGQARMSIDPWGATGAQAATNTRSGRNRARPIEHGGRAHRHVLRRCPAVGHGAEA